MLELPEARDSEAQVLGAIIVQPGLLVALEDIVQPEHFTTSTHRTLFTAAMAMYARGDVVDTVSLAAACRGTIDPIRVSDLAAGVLAPSSALFHARKVADAARLRELVLLGRDVSEAASTGDFPTVVSDAEKRLYAIARGGDRELVTWVDALEQASTRIEYLAQAETMVTGVPTGIRAVDEGIGGLNPRWVVLVGARPGVGKTAFAMQAAVHAAREGNDVLVVSLEMAASEIANRALCGMANVNYSDVRRRMLRPEDWDRLVKAQQDLADLPIKIYDQDIDTVAQVASRVRHHKPDVLVVDYLQLLRDPDARDRVQEVSSVSRDLKLLAKDTGVPVLAPVQLNRGPERREEKRPTMSDLRESGALEQDADVIYLLNKRPKTPERVEFILEKFRHGPTGSDSVGWDPTRTRFYDVAY